MLFLRLQSRFKLEQFGKVSCQTVRELAVKEIGFTRQNAFGKYVRKAFPSVYTRRSDRLRWYCGITLPEIDTTNNDKSRSEWLENASDW